MPIARRHTAGFKNPPLAAHTGRGPPAQEKNEPFSETTGPRPFLFAMFYLERRNQQDPDLRTLRYAAEV